MRFNLNARQTKTVNFFCDLRVGDFVDETDGGVGDRPADDGQRVVEAEDQVLQGRNRRP